VSTETPRAYVAALTSHPLLSQALLTGHILDAGCGSGSIGRALRGHGEVYGVEIDLHKALDARENLCYRRVDVCDFTEWTTMCDYSTVITHPWPDLAREFVEHAHSISDHVLALLPITMLTQRRHAMFFDDHPADVYPLADGADLAWYHWHPWATRRLEVLPCRG
jgi:predicted RNA methylase